MIALLMRLGLGSAAATGIQYALIGVVGLGISGYIVHAIKAPLQDKIANLEKSNEDLRSASKKKDEQIVAHSKRLEDDQKRLEEQDAAIEHLVNAPAFKSTACLLSAEQLLQLRKLAGQ